MPIPNRIAPGNFRILRFHAGESISDYDLIVPQINGNSVNIAVMLYRYIGDGIAAPEDRLGGYTDQDRISTWAGARDAVNWAVYHGIMGVNTTTLNPRGNATRAEAVTMLYRVVEIFDIPAP